MAPPHMMAQGSGDMDLRKLFQAPLPEGGEGSRMEEVLHIIINNEIDVNGDQNGMSLLHEAIQVQNYQLIDGRAGGRGGRGVGEKKYLCTIHFFSRNVMLSV